MTPNLTLYIALFLYACGTLVALGTLFARDKRTQHIALGLMIAGFVSHTVWIGTICMMTHHPPLTNLAEAAGFIAWCLFAVELLVFVIYRVHAAAFFVYPLVLMLLTISAVVREPFAQMDPSLRSGLFTMHVFFSTLGVASLLIGLAFTMLSFVQDRALKSKRRGAFWDWIPSLTICRTVGYRTLAIGFSIYTLGVLTGIVWSYRTTAELIDLRVKPIGGVVAWIFFGFLLQSYVSGDYRRRRTLVISACAFVSILVAMFGIHRV
jgi:ABC-type uncharacterized transport system permease subunit